jgi:hypothetical protein
MKASPLLRAWLTTVSKQGNKISPQLESGIGWEEKSKLF